MVFNCSHLFFILYIGFNYLILFIFLFLRNWLNSVLCGFSLLGGSGMLWPLILFFLSGNCWCLSRKNTLIRFFLILWEKSAVITRSVWLWRVWLLFFCVCVLSFCYLLFLFLFYSLFMSVYCGFWVFLLTFNGCFSFFAWV